MFNLAGSFNKLINDSKGNKILKLIIASEESDNTISPLELDEGQG